MEINDKFWKKILQWSEGILNILYTLSKGE
jgi:hypothetical protein